MKDGDKLITNLPMPITHVTLGPRGHGPHPPQNVIYFIFCFQNVLLLF